MHIMRVARFGVALMVAGMVLIGAGAAKAAPVVLGSSLGLSLTPVSGATTLPGKDITYSSPACPAGFQGSAVISAVDADGTTYSISVANNNAGTAFSGTLAPGMTMATIRDNGNAGVGGLQEVVVQCFSGFNGSGTTQDFVDTFIAWSLDGSSWSAFDPQSVCPTNTTPAVRLVASPNPAQPGQPVTLTASVMAPCPVVVPSGTVTFETDGTIIGSPVTLGLSGTASTTTIFSAAGSASLTAVFTPANPHQWSVSGSVPLAEQVIATGEVPPATSESLGVTVAPTGTFTVTLVNPANPAVSLTASGQRPIGATGTINQLQVQDTRNTYPGWYVTGQVSDFTAPASVPAGDIPGNMLGWVPTGTVQGGAVLGPPVNPGNPGLGTTAALLASATAGSGPGTSTLGATLFLIIPSTEPAGAYNGTLTLTVVPIAP
jgi:hypothetical protein